MAVAVPGISAPQVRCAPHRELLILERRAAITRIVDAPTGQSTIACMVGSCGLRKSRVCWFESVAQLCLIVRTRPLRRENAKSRARQLHCYRLLRGAAARRAALTMPLRMEARAAAL